MYREMEELTKKLVSIGSVNGSANGEKNVALYIEEYLREIPYFKEHSDYVIVDRLRDDALDRRNVFAYIKGSKKSKDDTIIFHGHIDTVGIEDYKNLMEYAFNPDVLKEEMLKLELDHEVREDLLSGDYMVGRGACDMKSGVAVFMVLIKYLSERTDSFAGNILLSVNPVEENLHTGIINGLDVLNMLKEREGFRYIMAINNDYICPLYRGDNKRYVYKGAVGKLLPCYYIQGKETHVGQCFEGFDASMAAAELVKEISLNTDYCDVYKGESTLPPSVLKMKDLKAEYNVQTSFDAFVYFNYFVHNEDIKSITDKLIRAGEKSLKNTLNTLNDNYKKYCQITKDKYVPYEYDYKVMTYEELYNMTAGTNESVKKRVSEYTKELECEKVDKREIPVYIIKYLLNELKLNKVVMVMYYAAPYCPHNTLKDEIPSEKELSDRLEKIVSEYADEAGEEYEILQFFPSLSDSSYLKIDDDNESIDSLISNFPEYETLYNVPLKKIKELDISAVNYGVYGKDAHKWTERLYMPYSFGVLPGLILKTIEEMLG